MPDTVRTLSALQTLLADNTSGNISPQDIRDFLVSVFTPQYAAARVSDPSGADQDIDATTVTAVTFDTEDFDTHGFADLGTNNTRLTVPTGMGGLYVIGGNVHFASSVEDYVDVLITKDGTTDIGQTTVEVGGLNPRVNISTIDVATAGAYYEIRVFVETTDQNITHTAQAPTFWIARLGQTPV